MSTGNQKTGILVIGAGELGTAVLKSLVTHPSKTSTSISLLLRQETISSSDPAKRSANDHLRSLGVSLVPGDVVSSDHDTLTSALRKFDTVIVCTGMYLPPGTQVQLAQLVLAAGVRHYIPWQFGVNYDAIGLGSAQDLFDEQLGVRALLRSQKETEWTILSTGMFTSFLFDRDFGIVDMDKSIVRALGDWATEVTVTMVEDIGRMVADIVWRPDEETKGVVFVAGDTISYGRLAEEVEKATGRQFTRERWSTEFLQGELQKAPESKLVKYRGVFAAGVGVSWPIQETFNQRRGIKLGSVQDYLSKHVDK